MSFLDLCSEASQLTFSQVKNNWFDFDIYKLVKKMYLTLGLLVVRMVIVEKSKHDLHNHTRNTSINTQ